MKSDKNGPTSVRSAKHTQKKYDKKVAKFYNEPHERFDLQARSREAIFKAIGENRETIGNPLKILDLGTGTGEFAKELSSLFTSSEIVGIDFSEKMIEIAKELNKENNRTRFIVDDALNLNNHYKDHFNLATIQFLLSYLDNSAVLNAINKSLQKDGILIITNTTLQSFPDLFDYFKKLYFKVMKRELTNSKIKENTFLPDSHDELCELVKKSGFKIIHDKLIEKDVEFRTYAELKYFATKRGWFLQIYEKVNFFLELVARVITKGAFPIHTRFDASLIIAKKQSSV